jgi:predicted ArsR family transcriptional regulator
LADRKTTFSGRKKKSLDEMIEEALKNAPKIEGYTVKQIAEIIGVPWPTARWHLELLEARGVVEHYDIGRAKVYYLKKKKRSQKD